MKIQNFLQAFDFTWWNLYQKEVGWFIEEPMEVSYFIDIYSV